MYYLLKILTQWKTCFLKNVFSTQVYLSQFPFVYTHTHTGVEEGRITCTLPPIGGISVVAGQAVLTLPPCGEIFTLLAHVAVDASAVSVTLAS